MKYKLELNTLSAKASLGGLLALNSWGEQCAGALKGRWEVTFDPQEAYQATITLTTHRSEEDVRSVLEAWSRTVNDLLWSVSVA